VGKLCRVKLTGHGLHGGAPASVELVPEPGPIRVEVEGVVRPFEAFHVVSTQFSTVIGCDAFEVRTVEHLFAALAGLGIREGLRIVVTGGEMPFLDGGARSFCDVLEPRRDAPKTRVVRAARFEIDGSIYELEPRDDVRVEVAVDLPAFCAREAAWNGEPDAFVREIAPARTFAIEHDLGELSSRGLARHVDPASVLVVTDTHIAGVGEISSDEPARHKLLDLIGDAYLHGGPPRGLVRATRPGHARNHVAFERAIAAGVIASSVFFLATSARADDPIRPPTLVELTHPWPEITLESTLASVTFTDNVQGTRYVLVDRFSFETPIAQSRWYVGAAYDAAIGHDDDGSPRFVSGYPEIWGRGVWNATYGLSFGGGLAIVIPRWSYSPQDPAATTAFSAIAARGWDRALFDPDNAMTFRPFIDIRLVSGPFTIQYRQALEIASNYGDVPLKLAAIGTLFVGFRFSKRITAGLDVIEYYLIDTETSCQADPSCPTLPDNRRAYIALGAHVGFETRYFRPTLGIMTNIGSPLDAIASIGQPISAAPTSFVGVHFSLDFPFDGVIIPHKKK
jgi:UDP-3-O-[3-hydroxymyristoyl] N-acetylglucosamine deacetylase